MTRQEYVQVNVGTVEDEFYDDYPILLGELRKMKDIFSEDFLTLWKNLRELRKRDKGWLAETFSVEALAEWSGFIKKNSWFISQVDHEAARETSDFFIKVIDKHDNEISCLPIEFGFNSHRGINFAGYGQIEGLIPMLLHDEVRQRFMADDFPIESINIQLTHSIGDSMNYVLNIIKEKDPDYYEKLSAETEMEVEL